MGRPRHERIRNLHTYPRPFVSPLQLAEYIGVTRRTIYNQIDKGALAVRRIGGVVCIPIAVARAYCGEDQRPQSA